MNKVYETTEYSLAIDTFFDWKIEDFPQFLQFVRKTGLESSALKIRAANDKEYPVKLVISPGAPQYKYDVRDLTARFTNKRGGIADSKDYVLLEVKVAAGGPYDIELVGTLELAMDDGSTFSGALGDIEDGRMDGRIWPIINKDYCVKLACKSTGDNFRDVRSAFCVPRASSSLKMKVKLTTPGKLSSITTNVPLTSKGKDASAVKLLSDIKALLSNATDSADFSIVCEDQSFPCHEAILRARSPVLDRMFQQKMKESISRKLCIADMKKETTSILIKYLYTGEVPRDVENLSELIYAADKYNISELLELCYDKVPDDDEKIVDILLAAERHNLVDLTKVVLDRFATTNLPEVGVKILDILIIAERNNLEDFKKVVMQKILMKKSMFLENEDFMNKLKENPSIVMELFKL